jgi:hypothetical protein
MKKEEALKRILGAWRSRPESGRQTEAQLAAFAMQIANDVDYSFQCRGDRYQDIMGYLRWNTSGLKKQGL